MKKTSIDLIVLLLWPIVAAILSFAFNVNYMVSVALFFILPSIYLSFYAKKYVYKALLYSAIISFPLYIITDYIGHVTKAWWIPNSIFPFRVFEFVTVESILWGFFLTYFTILFYERFLDKHLTKRLLNRKMKYLIVLDFVLLVTFLAFYLHIPGLFQIPYFYFVCGIVAVLIPILFELFYHYKLAGKFFLTGSYFFALAFIYEITAVKLKIWEFPGDQFIGWLDIFGVQFPFEELFFWIILGSIGILTYFEFFDDDQK